jgi:hypothetical protein
VNEILFHEGFLFFFAILSASNHDQLKVFVPVKAFMDPVLMGNLLPDFWFIVSLDLSNQVDLSNSVIDIAEFSDCRLVSFEEHIFFTFVR